MHEKLIIYCFFFRKPDTKNRPEVSFTATVAPSYVSLYDAAGHQLLQSAGAQSHHIALDEGTDEHLVTARRYRDAAVWAAIADKSANAGLPASPQDHE